MGLDNAELWVGVGVGMEACLPNFSASAFWGFLGSPSRASPPALSVCHQSHLSIYLSNFLSVCLSVCPIAGVTCTHVGHVLEGFGIGIGVP